MLSLSPSPPCLQAEAIVHMTCAFSSSEQKVVTALDRTWHPEHFFCAQCGAFFGPEGTAGRTVSSLNRRGACEAELLAGEGGGAGGADGGRMLGSNPFPPWRGGACGHVCVGQEGQQNQEQLPAVR